MFINRHRLHNFGSAPEGDNRRARAMPCQSDGVPLLCRVVLCRAVPCCVVAGHPSPCQSMPCRDPCSALPCHAVPKTSVPVFPSVPQHPPHGISINVSIQNPYTYQIWYHTYHHQRSPVSAGRGHLICLKTVVLRWCAPRFRVMGPSQRSPLSAGLGHLICLKTVLLRWCAPRF